MTAERRLPPGSASFRDVKASKFSNFEVSNRCLKFNQAFEYQARSPDSEVLTMKYRILLAATAMVMLGSPLTAHAQGIPDGITHGAYVGSNAAGPIGAVVGGAVGGIVGGFEGTFGIGPQYAAIRSKRLLLYTTAYIA
jgi:hypothetical protein